ncbi:MAG: hypothetical protein LBS85_04675 [Clostridiales Family XIII bacterium]|nr:hypothetical protein [Clostridiales Family XIII bacterium]
MLIFFSLLLALLGLRLFQIIGVEGDRWSAEATENTVRQILTDAPRGEIFDRNGVLLAGNRLVYTVNFSRNDMTAAQTNESAAKLIAILEKHGETWTDNFPIRISEDGGYYYTYDTELALWLEQQQIPAEYTAEQAFDEIRRRYNIEEGLDRFDAQRELMDKHGVYPPIVVASEIEYKEQWSKKKFLESFGITDAHTDARTAFEAIKKWFGVTDAEMAAKILAVRYELSTSGFMRYMPSKVASNIKQETVVEIEENLHNLSGASVLTEWVRYYPEGEAASHIIGYMGRISDEDKEAYVEELGYRPSDMIGLYGIEKSQEDILHGTYGSKTVQIDKYGTIIQTIGEEVKAKKGEDIALTIDINLEKQVKDDLLRGIEAVSTGSVYESRFGNVSMSKRANCDVAAAAILDVKTGEPLALVNSDEFDPNLFAEGISLADWNALQGENPRDPLSPRPLYNWATSAAVQPGSTFKPMVAISALESGLSPTQLLYDAHSVKVGDHVFSCLGSHGSVNLYTAMQVSCNFYFYDVATGRDWSRGGTDIGYKDNISIDKITDYAKQFGLGIESDIEIEETVVGAPTAEKKLAGTEALLRNYLIGQCEYIFTEAALKNKEKVLESISEIAGWAEENPSVADLKERMLKLGVKEDEVQAVAENCKYSYYNFAQWSDGDALNIAIGQGENAFTPLQMAQYMATLGNGGTKNSLSLIKATESQGEVARAPGTPANITNPENLVNVRTAMGRVVSGGTLGSFRSLPVTTIGKTGTAERAGRINPPDEVAYMQEHLGVINPALNWDDVAAEMYRLMEEFPTIYDSPNNAVRRAVLNLSGRSFNSDRLDMFKGTYDNFAWVVALAPAEDPQIAVAVLLVQGGTSLNAAPVAREIIGDYFDLQAQYAAEGKAVNWGTFFEESHYTE